MDRLCRFKHNAHEHPLMELARLRELAHFLMPQERCRFVTPDIRQDSAFDSSASPHDGRSLDDVFERIEEAGSWIALYRVEHHPDYARFVEEVISVVRPAVESQQGAILAVNGFIFISAPPSVTPFHIDRENNFWLQIRGRKTMTVFDAEDRELVPEHCAERFMIHRSLEGVALEERYRSRGVDTRTQPGDGLYFPSLSPHMTESTTDWVQPGDGVSISIGVVFYTEHTRRMARVYQTNSVLRRLGYSPKAPGHGSDRLKGSLGRALI
ncbi:MAG: cupin-like domain-containing protein, partial [Myxococcota bacterium]